MGLYYILRKKIIKIIAKPQWDEKNRSSNLGWGDHSTVPHHLMKWSLCPRHMYAQACLGSYSSSVEPFFAHSVSLLFYWLMVMGLKNEKKKKIIKNFKS